MKAQGIVKALKEKAFEEGAEPVKPEQITFDFNKYPQLWDPYQKLPEAIKKIFDPYITKLFNPKK